MKSDTEPPSDVARWVVVPMDQPPDGLKPLHTALDLAERIDAGVRLFSVVGSPEEAVGRQDVLQALADEIETVDATVVIGIGSDVECEILNATDENDIVCMATAASLLPHQGHFGSIAEAVVRMVQRPVVLLGPAADPSMSRGLGRIVVPVDGSVRSETAVEPAAALSRLLDIPLWVVTVVPLAQQRAAAAQLGREAAATESSYVRQLAKRAVSHGASEAQFEVLHMQDAAPAILDFAHPDGLVVMSTHGKTGLRRLFAGSVTTSVVARSTHPVIVLRPPDDLLASGAGPKPM